MTRVGAKSKSSSAPPADSLRLTSTQRPATTHPATSPSPFSHASKRLVIPRALFARGPLRLRAPFARRICFFFVLASLVFVLSSIAQDPLKVPTKQPPPPGQASSNQGSTIKVGVNLVVLHTTVLDDRGRFADGLKPENFRVFEDKTEQKVSVFKREDVPVSMGLVIDNSGSMRDKRPRVNEAAVTLVQASNPQDEAFVVNFNDDYYLDLDKDFTSSVPELKEALERIDARGSTALYDALIGSLDHLKKAHKDKHVLLVVTDGEDNTSRNSLEKTIKEIQKTDTVIYTIGLLSEEKGKAKTKAKKALKEIADASGGLAYFPENVEDVHNICDQVAHDIRNQYILGYYPTNFRPDGTYRAVSVEVIPPRGRGKLIARTRNGYYAPNSGSGAPAGSASSGQ